MIGGSTATAPETSQMRRRGDASAEGGSRAVRHPARADAPGDCIVPSSCSRPDEPLDDGAQRPAGVGRGRSSQANTTYSETIAFGRRSPLPPSPAMSTVRAPGRAPPAYYGIAARELSSAMPPPPRTAGSAYSAQAKNRSQQRGAAQVSQGRAGFGGSAMGSGSDALFFGGAHAATAQQLHAHGAQGAHGALSQSLPHVGVGGGGGGGGGAHPSRGLSGGGADGSSRSLLGGDGRRVSTLSGDGPTHGHKDATASTPLSVTGGGPLAVPGGKKISSEAAVVDLEGTSAEALQDEIDDLADRLAQVERVTSMLTPGYTAGLQRQLQASFSTIGERMVDIDTTLLTDAQKRAVAAAVVIQSGARMNSARSSGSAELHQVVEVARARRVAAPIVAGFDSETIDESTTRMGGPAYQLEHASEWRRLAVEGRPMRQELDAELHSRRYAAALCRKVFCGWQRVAHRAALEVRWWTEAAGAWRCGRRWPTDGAATAWRRWTYRPGGLPPLRRPGEAAGREGVRRFRDEWQRRWLRRSQTRDDHGKAYFHIPFRAWYLHMVDSRSSTRCAMLIGSFQRRLERRRPTHVVARVHCAQDPRDAPRCSRARRFSHGRR